MSKTSTTSKRRRRHTGVMCVVCGDRLFSFYRHDFKYCSCKSTFVDGGREYLRYGYSPGYPPRMIRYCKRDEAAESNTK